MWERENTSHCRHGKEITRHNTLAKRTLFGMLPIYGNTCTYNFIHTQYTFPFHAILFNNTQGIHSSQPGNVYENVKMKIINNNAIHRRLVLFALWPWPDIYVHYQEQFPEKYSIYIYIYIYIYVIMSNIESFLRPLVRGRCVKLCERLQPEGTSLVQNARDRPLPDCC